MLDPTFSGVMLSTFLSPDFPWEVGAENAELGEQCLSWKIASPYLPISLSPYLSNFVNAETAELSCVFHP